MGLLVEIAVVALALFVSVRYGARYALAGAALLGMVLTFVSWELVLLLCKSGLCGILLDVGRRARAPFSQMMTIALLPAALLTLALALFPLFNAEELARELISSGSLSGGWMQSLYGDGDAQETLHRTLVFFLRLSPGVGFLSTFLAAAIAYALCRRWLRRYDVELPPLPPFTSWRMWDHFVWVLTLGVGLSVSGNPVVAGVGWNMILAMGALYFMQGLAVVHSRLFRLRSPKMAAIFFYVALAATFSISVFLVAALGVLDIWLPLRKRGQPDALA